MKPAGLAARILLAVAALVFGAGAILHARAASKSFASIDASTLPSVLGKELKVLWLADSTTLLAVAIICAMLAARPAAASRGATMLIAIVPAATAVLLYTFLGGFYAGHLLLGTSLLVLIAGWLPRSQTRRAGRTPIA